MLYLAGFILVFSVLQLLVSLANLVFSQSFAGQRINGLPLVSILIPARNEEKNIGSLLKDLLEQDYQNIEIIVFNDQSTDQTAEMVNRFIQNDSKVRLIHSTGLPRGWLGKNYACYKLGQEAKGEYFLFLDADVRIGNEIIRDTVGMSQKHRLGLISIFPTQIMGSFGEWISVPVMNYILLSLLPLILVRKSGFPSLAAANGQFMLFNAGIYKKHEPHEKVKTSKVEDIDIARIFKKQNIKIACLPGNESIKCRMYQSFPEAVHGFSKNVIHFFGNSYVFAILFWFITSFGFLLVLNALPGIFTIFLIFSILVNRILVSVVSRQNVLYNLACLVPQQLSMGIFIYRALRNSLKKQYEWKGRTV